MNCKVEIDSDEIFVTRGYLVALAAVLCLLSLHTDAAASRLLDRPISIFSANQSPELLTPAPELCAGLGSVAMPLNFSEDWEGGVLPGGWSIGNRDVANPATFDASDWIVTGAQPSGANGVFSAFGDNPNLGDCGADDETGVTWIRSPAIVLDSNETFVAFDHWFETEFALDGGNVKISVNGGAELPIPVENFVFNPYNLVLNTVDNSNPMAGENTFSGSSGGEEPGIWAQTQLSLVGLAGAGDSVEFVFELGMNGCGGVTGWYVDDMSVYSCDGVIVPVCGNSVLESGEQCDDGNAVPGDGCSDACQVESGFNCTAPVASNTDNLVADPGFEAGPFGGVWDEFSFNFLTPLCTHSDCGLAGQRTGGVWTWFGGIADVVEEGHVAQMLVLPDTVSDIRFWLKVAACDSVTDYVELLIDDQQVWQLQGDDPACGQDSYQQIVVDISGFADGKMHESKFHSETFSDNMGFSDFFIDDVEILHGPISPISSMCEFIAGFIFGSGFEADE